ncbi:MAG: MMPL family transporter, partial [Pseudomonadota bacterium]
HVQSYTDIMKRLNKSMHGDDESYYRLPDDRELAAQYLLLFEFSLPYGLDLNDQINVDKSATRLVVTMINISTNQLKDLRERATAFQQENLPPEMLSISSGQAVMFAFIGWNNFKAMSVGTALALVLISGIMVVALRSLKLGVVSLVPNLAPPIVAIGAFAIFDGTLGFWANFLVATALGLIVDATVHFLSKYQRARREDNATAEDAVRYAFRRVGAPLWVSTFVLALGFGVLFYSPFLGNSMYGILVSAIVLVALILDFLLLPALLLVLDGGDKAQTAAPTSPEPGGAVA